MRGATGSPAESSGRVSSRLINREQGRKKCADCSATEWLSLKKKKRKNNPLRWLISLIGGHCCDSLAVNCLQQWSHVDTAFEKKTVPRLIAVRKATKTTGSTWQFLTMDRKCTWNQCVVTTPDILLLAANYWFAVCLPVGRRRGREGVGGVLLVRSTI